MVRGSLVQPAMVLMPPARPSKPWLLLPAILVATAVGTAIALAPLPALLALPVMVIVACVWKWPALAAYLVIGLTPLTAGISRGGPLPLVRPHEALALLVGVALATRGIAQLRTGQVPKLRLDGVEASIVLLAITSSVVPLVWMTVRQQPITTDDLLYTLVLWKYLGLYALIRMSVHTDREIRRCLWVSVATACIVAVLAILQSLGLPGLSQILATEYAPVAATGGLLARGSSTLGLPAATADLMLYNLAIVSGLDAGLRPPNPAGAHRRPAGPGRAGRRRVLQRHRPGGRRRVHRPGDEVHAAVANLPADGAGRIPGPAAGVC